MENTKTMKSISGIVGERTSGVKKYMSLIIGISLLGIVCVILSVYTSSLVFSLGSLIFIIFKWDDVKSRPEEDSFGKRGSKRILPVSYMMTDDDFYTLPGSRIGRQDSRLGQECNRIGHEDGRPGHEASRPGHEDSRPDHEYGRPGHEDSRLGHEDGRPGHKDSRLGHEDDGQAPTLYYYGLTRDLSPDTHIL